MTTRPRHPVQKPPGTSRGKPRAREPFPWWFAVPALVTYLGIVVLPTLQGATVAFTDWNGLSPDRSFVGLENFRQILSDNTGGAAALRTIVIAAFTTTLVNFGGLALALALNTKIKSRNVLRTIFFAPVVISPLVVGYVFKFILSPGGPLNEALRSVGLDALALNWLGEPVPALASIIFVVSWQSMGTAMVIYLAGLQGVPAELIEAAEVDGAGPARRFWHIVRPLLAPAITINLMLSLVSGLRVFDQIYSMTQGGPAGSTHSLATLFINQAYVFGNYGYAAALAVILTLLVALFSSIQYLVLRRQPRQ
jgi:raffinose/stachyose/melibiose transport system permease protein